MTGEENTGAREEVSALLSFQKLHYPVMGFDIAIDFTQKIFKCYRNEGCIKPKDRSLQKYNKMVVTAYIFGENCH